jgi:hypothetical protein
MPLKEGSIATTKDPHFGPIFGEFDISIEYNQVRSNYHTYLASYMKVELPTVPATDILIGGSEASLENYELIQLCL